MRAEKLRDVIYSLKEEVKSLNIINILNRFQQLFTTNITQPSPAASEQFIDTRQELFTILENALSNNLPPSRKNILKSIKGDVYFGKGLKASLENIIDENVSTPGQAIQQINEFLEKTKIYYSLIESTENNLKSLNIQCDYTDKDEYEIGILMPTSIFQNNIEGLIKELEILNRHLKVFGEIAGDDTSSPTIRNISDGTLDVFLNSLPEVASFFIDAIEKICVAYFTIIQIRKYREELRNKKVPDKVLEPLEKHENQIMSDEIDKIADELFDKYRKKQDKHREKELKGLLVKSLKYLAVRIDKGIDYEVTPPSVFDEPTDDSSDDVKAEYERIIQDMERLASRGIVVSTLPERKTPILSLPEPTTDNDEEQLKK